MSKCFPFFKFYLILVLLVIMQLSKSQRRIKDGYPVQDDKRYAVYLLKVPNAKVRYSDWTCGGAIVSPNFVITSAACIEDVVHIYVIAGYRKFAPSSELESDPCLRTKKKKVIFTCTPLRYDFDYNVTEKWANIDIAVVQVESPYDFTDSSFEIHCSYTPQPIKINYNYRYQEPGLEAMVMGWGHNDSWRSIYDNKRYNQELLHYVPTIILDKQTCIKYYNANKEMPRIINKYMICTLYEGNIDDQGEIIKAAENFEFLVDGCTEDELRNGNECAQEAETYRESETIEAERDITGKIVKNNYARKRRNNLRKHNTLKNLRNKEYQNFRVNNVRHRKNNKYDYFGQSIDYNIDSQESIMPTTIFKIKYMTLPKSNKEIKKKTQERKEDLSLEYNIDTLENINEESSIQNVFMNSNKVITAMKNVSNNYDTDINYESNVHVYSDESYYISETNTLAETTTEETTETTVEATIDTTTEETTETSVGTSTESATETTNEITTEVFTETTTISSTTTNLTIKNITEITSELIDTTANNNTFPETVSEYTTESRSEKERPGVDLPGICQNDHGGPLVAWVGKQEVLIGVATLFKLNDEGHCIGPYLFTSTQCNSAFLNCILSMEAHPDEIARICMKLEKEGIKLVQRRVSWIGHQDGPADNEQIQHREQKSLRDYI